MEPYEYKKSAEELRGALERQLGHLRHSNQIYDGGRVEEAERIAATLYVLFADIASNRALTKLTGLRGQLRFPDTRANASNNRPQEYFVGPLLCVLGGAGEYLPPLAGNGEERWPLVTFHKWWNEIVYETDRGLSLARKNLVFALGNQDGGRHVDRKLRDEAYHWLKARGDVHVRARPNSGWTIYLNPKWVKSGEWVNLRGQGDNERRAHLSSTWPPPEDAAPLKNGHWATMRQMGWEADEALKAAGF